MNVSPHTARTISVLLISRYRIVQESLQLLIDSNRGLRVSGTYSFAEGGEHRPEFPLSDVAVVYLSAGDRTGIIAELLEHMPEIRVIVIIESEDLESQAEALKLGAVGIVHKEQNPRLLIEAIRQTYNGETWLNQVLLNKLLERGKTNGKASKPAYQVSVASLTAREREVIQMIGEGLKNKSIAKRLLISEATVRHHLSSIYGKIGVEDRLNLVIFAYQNGIISLSDQMATMNVPR